MIKKFLTIRNIGVFSDYSSSGDIEFRKLNIIYSENGRGKTTLTAILRSLCENDNNLVGRKTLGSKGDIETKILLEDNITAKFNGVNWDNCFTDFEIFDSKFIEDNVFSGSYVEQHHKRNLCRFVLGEEGVNLVKKYDGLTEKITEQKNKLKEKKTEIKENIIGDLSEEKFIELKEKNEIENLIKEKELFLDTLKKAAKLKNTSNLKTIKFPEILIDKLKTLLLKTLTDISKEAEENIKKHITNCMDSKGEKWIRDGIPYIIKNDNTCPFCKQSIKDVEIIKYYKQYFSDEYNNLKKEVESFTIQIEKALAKEKLFEINESIINNNNIISIWEENLADLELQEIIFENIKKAWDELLKIFLDALNDKNAALLEPYNSIDDIDISYTSFIREATIVSSY